jgi:hypothetical protein
MRADRQLFFRGHAIRRMFQRGITTADIHQIIDAGEVIESRLDDLPYPSRLVLGYVSGRALHVVLADNEPEGTTIVVTVYEPSPALWHRGFRKRRKP